MAPYALSRDPQLTRYIRHHSKRIARQALQAGDGACDRAIEHLRFDAFSYHMGYVGRVMNFRAVELIQRTRRMAARLQEA